MKHRCRALPLCLAASLLLLGLGLRPATGQLLGPEFQVNTYTTNSQWYPAMAADGAGNFVVVWESLGQDGSLSGVFGQRFNSAGSRLGSEFQVNTFTTNYQRDPAVAADGTGNLVVVWHSFAQDGAGWGVFGKRFDSAGTPVGSEFQVNSYTTRSQFGPAVAADGAGNFAVVWGSASQDGSNYGVFGQRFNSLGGLVGSEFQVNSYTTQGQRDPAVAADGAGNFVVVWHSLDQDGSSWGVFGQRFDSAGTPVGSEFQVNSYTTNAQSNPAVAADGPGNFVVVWQSRNQSVYTDVFGQRFNSAGSKVGSEFQVNSEPWYRNYRPAVAADSAGNFVVAWQSLYQSSYYANYFVSGQRFNSAGSRVGSSFQVNAYADYGLVSAIPPVAADGAGNFVVVWHRGRNEDGSDYGVFGKQLTIAIFSNGFEAGDACAWSAAVGGGC